MGSIPNSSFCIADFVVEAYAFEEMEHSRTDVNKTINGIFEGKNEIGGFLSDIKLVDTKLRKGNVMIHCNKCQNRNHASDAQCRE